MTAMERFLYPFPWDRNHRTLFDLMMYRGKIAWITEKALGSEDLGAKILGYDEHQLEWCRKNKKQFIEWINKAGHLESTDPMIIRAYLQPMPNPVLKEDVPPMIGIWLGMQYIDEYMKKNSGVTLEELLKNTDYERMLMDIDIQCPVLDFMGKVIAGISVSGPKVRMSMERIENEIAPLLIEAAHILSCKFGYMGSDDTAE